MNASDNQTTTPDRSAAENVQTHGMEQAERAMRLLTTLTTPSTSEEQARLRRGLQALLRAGGTGRVTFRWRGLR